MPTIRRITSSVTVYVDPDPFVAVERGPSPSGRSVRVAHLRLNLRLNGIVSDISGEGFAVLRDGTPGKTWVRSLLLAAEDLPDALRMLIRTAVDEHLTAALAGRPAVNVTAGT